MKNKELIRSLPYLNEGEELPFSDAIDKVHYGQQPKNKIFLAWVNYSIYRLKSNYLNFY